MHQLRDSGVSPPRLGGRWFLRDGEGMFVLSLQRIDAEDPRASSQWPRDDEECPSLPTGQAVASDPRSQAHPSPHRGDKRVSLTID